MSDSEDGDWAPPTEAQMKVIQAKRERSDKISKLMGDYLLKGYKMLATSCPVCFTVELQDRAGLKFCVACQEVDCHETSKDDPALSRHAAERVVEEEAFTSSNTTETVTHPSHTATSQSTPPPPLRSQSPSLPPLSSLAPPPLTSQSPSLPPLSSLAPPPLTSQSSSLPPSLAPTSHQSAPVPLSPLASYPSHGAGARPRMMTATTRMSVTGEDVSECPQAALLTKSLRAVTATLEQANRDLEEGVVDIKRRVETVILVREAATTMVTLKQLLSDQR